MLYKLLLIICMITLVVSHTELTHSRNFRIKSSSSEDEQELHEYIVSTNNYQCKIEFTLPSNNEIINADIKKNEKKISIETVAEKMASQCVSQKSNAEWEYTVCFSEKNNGKASVVQHNRADKYILGTEQTIRDNTIMFINGDDCAGKLRTVQVNFVCAKHVMTAFVQVVTEPVICEYVVTIVTSLVCGDSSYPLYNADNLMIVDTIQDWYLDLSEVEGDNRGAVCSMYTTETLPTTAKHSFGSIRMTMTAMEDKFISNIPNVVARKHNRNLLKNNELTIDTNDNSIVVYNSKEFKEVLYYLKLSSGSSSSY